MVCAIPSALHAFLSSPTNVIAAVILLLVLTALWSVLLPNGFPPGPVAWPFLGISSALKGDLSKALTDLTERYGDILSIKVSGRRKVVINDVNMVREALVKKQNEFAGRPWRYYLGLLSEGGESIFHCSYSPKWMTRRKLLVRAIRNATSGRKMNDSIGKAILQLKNSVDDRNEEPFNPRHYFQLTVGGAVASMCFGRKYGFDDPEFQEIIKTAENVVKGFGQRFSADVFPILRHVPTKGVCEIKKVISRWLMLIQSKIDQRKAKPNEGEVYSVVDDLLKCKKDADSAGEDGSSCLTDVHLRQMLSDVIIASMDTTVTTLTWLIAYLVNYPDVQIRMREEIDDVIGRESVLLSSDTGKLPYCRAVILEVLRIRTNVPRGVPHETLDDTCVERFLDGNGQALPTPNTFIPFSAGRRKCLGEPVAMHLLIRACVGLLQHFTISTAPEQGKPSLEPVFGDGTTKCRSYEIVARRRIDRAIE
ncbi:cytochrome P450 1A1-like isoform X2 [Ptychodera flava]|uniref:cytochrome P450 1A1-like isoform X2 n=1 Tax=Ptychodera flava TaxID=63121 RepID=UPI003969E520